jgi:phospholipase D-like protein
MPTVIDVEAAFALATLGLWLFCLVEVVQSPESNVRNLPKVTWLLIVLFFPLVGSAAWLAAGRPDRAPRAPGPQERSVPAYPEYDRPGRAAATDPAKDEEFLRQIRERAEQQRREYERKRREQHPDGS